MKSILKLTIFSISLFLLGCSKEPTFNFSFPIHEANYELKIGFATDLHYLAPSLTDNGAPFINLLKKGDGKIIHFSEEILDSLISNAKENHLDYLIIPGDLTYNGEKESHLNLAKKLNKLEKSGIKVLLIPGNHDIDSYFSYSFSGNEGTKVENISYQDFKDIYSEFGYSDAIIKDENSFSYIYPLKENLYAIFLDTNAEGAENKLKAKTLKWLESSLEALGSESNYISITHQNLTAHNKNFIEGFIIQNSEDILKIYEKYNVKLNLTGHIHIQHISKSDNLNEISTGALASYPHSFAKINIDSSNNLSYSSESLPIKTKDMDFEEFKSYSKGFFYETTYKKSFSKLDEIDNITTKEKEFMADFSSLVNIGYFSGDLYKSIEDLKLHKGYSLWNDKAKTNFFNSYLNSVFEEKAIDNTKFEINLN